MFCTLFLVALVEAVFTLVYSDVERVMWSAQLMVCYAVTELDG